MAKSTDPTREVARLALAPSASANATLQEVIQYALDQLCWTMATDDLLELLDGLKSKIAAEA